MGDRQDWQGTPTRLLQELAAVTTQESRGKSWPQSPVHVTRQLNRLATVLRSVGLEVSRDRTETEKLIRLEKVEKLPSLPSGLGDDEPEPLYGELFRDDGNPDGNSVQSKLPSGNRELPSSAETIAQKEFQDSADGNDGNDGKKTSFSMPTIGDRVQVITGGKFKDQIGTIEGYDPTDQTYSVRFANGSSGHWLGKHLEAKNHNATR
jgi:hypothetical protein